MLATLIALMLGLGVVGAQAHSAAASAPAMPASQVIAQADVATAVALGWLAHVDAGRVQASYTEAGQVFRAAITEAQWTQVVQAARGPLGELRTRQPLSARMLPSAPPGMPQGDYMVLQFKAVYAHSAQVTERVTLMREGSAWRVVGYFLT